MKKKRVRHAGDRDRTARASLVFAIFEFEPATAAHDLVFLLRRHHPSAVSAPDESQECKLVLGLRTGIPIMAEQNLPDALVSLEKARGFYDTEFIRGEIDKVKSRMAQSSPFSRQMKSGLFHIGAVATSLALGGCALVQSAPPPYKAANQYRLNATEPWLRTFAREHPVESQQVNDVLAAWKIEVDAQQH